jgi:hypothetical protein
MKSNALKALVVLCALQVLFCTRKPFFDIEPSQIFQIDDLPEDFIVPNVVWNVMVEKKTDDQVKSKPKPILYTFVKVFLKEKNEKVLKSPILGFEFTRGGGELDLATIKGAKPGSFFLGFEMPEFEGAQSQRVLFISQSKKRKVEGEILGSGCNKVLDITAEVLKGNKEQGIKINTTRDRHTSILAGHMIFIAETEKNWLLSQVTFLDSSRADLLCPNFRIVPGVQ